MKKNNSNIFAYKVHEFEIKQFTKVIKKYKLFLAHIDFMIVVDIRKSG